VLSTFVSQYYFPPDLSDLLMTYGFDLDSIKAKYDANYPRKTNLLPNVIPLESYRPDTHKETHIHNRPTALPLHGR